MKLRNAIKSQKLSKINISRQQKKIEATIKTNCHLKMNGTHAHC